SRRRHTRSKRDWSSDVCSSDLSWPQTSFEEDLMTTPTTERPAAAHGVTLTPGAAQKVNTLLEQEGRDDLRLRIAVQPGGCSGLIYQLYFDERTMDNDLVADFDGVEVVVD